MNAEERRQYGRDHYQANKAVYKRRAREHKTEVVARQALWVNDLKSSVPCADCDLHFPHVAMDFDHVEATKVKSIARMVRDGGSWKRLFAEIMKCEIVCSNCHRVRTSDRLSS